MLVMLVIVIILGLVLVVRINLLLLFMGVVVIGVVIFYIYGLVLFLCFLLGELLLGCVEGFGVFFLSVYMNVVIFVLVGFKFVWL